MSVILSGFQLANLRDWIVAAGVEGMTTSDAPRTQPRAFDQTVFLNSLVGVCGTRRLKPTVLAEHR
jgi:hypothetical protein